MTALSLGRIVHPRRSGASAVARRSTSLIESIRAAHAFGIDSILSPVAQQRALARFAARLEQ